MALGITVVSTMTQWVLALWMKPPRQVPWTVIINNVCTPSSPMRFLQPVRLLGFMGASIGRYVSPQNYRQ